MAKSVFQELERFADEIEFVASGSRDIKDVTAYLKSKRIPDSTARGRIDDIKKHKSVLLIFEEPSTVTLNRAELEQMIEGICKILKVEKTSVETTGVAAALSNLKTSSGEKKVQIDALKKESEELKKEISKRDAIISELQDKEKTLSEALRDAGRKSLEIPVVIVSTEEILPRVTEWEKQFVKQIVEASPAENKSEEKEEAKQKVEEQEAKPKEEKVKKDNVLLTYANYVRRGIKQIFTAGFLQERISCLLESQGKTEFSSNKQYVNNLLAETGYTNQQKLALYAAFSEYRHSDFEKLLNFAGDNNVDANLLIQWVESLGDEQDFLQIKNALRQFAKPTEYKMKYDLARELLLGHWQVQFYRNGVPTKFRLVSETDIEKVKKELGLSDSAFTYHDYVTYETAKQEKEEAMVKKKKKSDSHIEAPKFIERYFMRDDDIIPDDYDLEDDAVNYGEFADESEEKIYE